MKPDEAAARALLSARAVRERARLLYGLAADGRLDGWRLCLDRLPVTADYVTQVIRDRYPHLNPPFHARWRHFEFDGRDLWREITALHVWRDPAARARAEFDLAVVSVLLDAGAPPAWRYHDARTGLRVGRSEGLALASLRWFEGGALSGDPSDPLRADAAVLEAIDAAALHAAFQVGADNAFPGLESRAALLNRVGAALREKPYSFALADTPRPGGLFDRLVDEADAGRLPAARILEALLDSLGGIWLGRPVLAGVPLGDCWPHPACDFVPLHKLSQWLSYSTIEPLQRAGIVVTDIDGLTGLAEYRNGGLFLDLGVLQPDDAALLTRVHDVSDPFIVGWRALTVALLDDLAPLVRARLGVEATVFPLACLLEGGTWAAGRRIAAERRADGGPPLQIRSDGTVF
jgi:hypothetical protein